LLCHKVGEFVDSIELGTRISCGLGMRAISPWTSRMLKHIVPRQYLHRLLSSYISLKLFLRCDCENDCVLLNKVWIKACDTYPKVVYFLRTNAVYPVLTIFIV